VIDVIYKIVKINQITKITVQKKNSNNTEGVATQRCDPLSNLALSKELSIVIFFQNVGLKKLISDSTKLIAFK
jgi:hypothetical protein